MLSFSQQPNLINNCRVLQSTINQKTLKEHFYIKENDKLITIVDTNFIFQDCVFNGNESLPKIVVSRSYPDVKINASTSEKYRDIIIMYRFEKKGNYYYISLWKPYGNAFIEFKVKLKSKKDKVKLVSLGVF